MTDQVENANRRVVFWRVLLLHVLLCVVAGLRASELLTNADVVRLVKAGLGSETIIAKITTSPSAFATDTESLIALAKDGVPDAVITAMVHARPTPAPTQPAGPQGLPARTPTPAKVISRRWQVGVLVLREYPDEGTIGACNGNLIADEQQLYAGPSERCTAAPSFTLRWATITSVCYAYEETIPTYQLGRRWHGTVRITAGGKEYLLGLGDRSQFDALRSFFHEYRGNIPEQCASGPGATITPAQSGFPLVHPSLQHRPDKLRTCMGALTLTTTGLQYEVVAGECAGFSVAWERINRLCYEEPFWTSRQLTFYGTNGEEWNFFSHGTDGDRSLRDLHEQLTKAKPDLTDHCD